MYTEDDNKGKNAKENAAESNKHKKEGGNVNSVQSRLVDHHPGSVPIPRRNVLTGPAESPPYNRS